MSLLFANNFTTTLALPAAPGDTTMTLLATTGLPNPTGGNYFVLSLFDAATGLVDEIIWVTAVNFVSNVITVTRAQEGTTAHSWLSGDRVTENWTAGQAAAMAQILQVQQQLSNFAVAGGSANAITATYSPAIASHVQGMPLRFLAVNNNTGATTFNPGPGATSITAPDSSALIAGDLEAGMVYEVIYNGVTYDLQNAVQSTTTRPGIAPYATNAQAGTGTDTTHIITPATLQYKLGTLVFGTAAFKNTTNNSLAFVAAVSGTIVSGHLASFVDNVGTVQDSGFSAASFDAAGSAAGALASANAYANANFIPLSYRSSAVTVVAGVISATNNNFPAFSDGAGTLKDSGYGPGSFDTAGSAASAYSSAVGYTNSYAAGKANNLSDLSSIATARTNLGLDYSFLSAVDGYYQHPGGYIEQWVTLSVNFAGTSFVLASVSWPETFPSTCFNVVAVCNTNDVFSPGSAGNNFTVAVTSFNQSGCTVRLDTEQGRTPVGTVLVYIQCKGV